MGAGASYGNGTTCYNCTGEWRVGYRVECPHAFHAVWGFQDSNGNTITSLLVYEREHDDPYEVVFTVIIGKQLGARRVNITSTQITASKTLQ